MILGDDSEVQKGIALYTVVKKVCAYIIIINTATVTKYMKQHHLCVNVRTPRTIIISTPLRTSSHSPHPHLLLFSGEAPPKPLHAYWTVSGLQETAS